MDAKILFNKILDLAIRGRLTEQLESDGSAQDLIDQIENEKKREIEEYNKANPKKAQKKYVAPKTIPSEDIPFEIPGNWKWVRLGDVISLISGQDFPPEKYNSESKGIPYITGASNIENDKLLINRWTEYPSVISIEGDLLFVCKGSGVGKMAFNDYGELHIARQIQALRNKKGLNTVYVQNVISVNINRIISKAIGLIPGIGRELLLNFPFPLPPLSEQKRIVSKLEEIKSKIDKYIENEEAINNDCDILRNKVLDLAIKGGLTEQLESDGSAQDLIDQIENEKKREIEEYNKANPKKTQKKYVAPKPIPSEDIPFEIPGNWKWVRLGEVAKDMADGPFGSNLKKEHYTQEREARIIQLSNIGEEGWREENTKYTTFDYAQSNISRSIVSAGEIVIAKMMPAGRAIICPNHEKMFVLSSDAIRLSLYDSFNKAFMLNAINSPHYRSKICENVNGMGRERTSIVKLKESLIPLPPLAEQKRIVAKLEEIFGKIDKIKNGIPKSEKVFKFPEAEEKKMPVAAESGTQFSGKGR